jgi:hypothetical protein
MTMKNTFRKYGILLAFLVTACNLDGDLENPNQVPVNGADVDYLMNLVQLNFADFFQSAQSTGAPLVRQVAMSGGYRYQLAYQPQGQDVIWTNAYNGILLQSETLIKLAEEKNLTTHVAVAKILSAYTYLTLVDLFNDVPRTEALTASTGNFNPVADPGSDVYAYAIGLLGEARTELAKTGTDAGRALARDIYYGGDRAKWTALCNTIELKAWVNISMVPSRQAEANAKIATFINPADGSSVGEIIDKADEDFTYKYSAITVPAGSRHPLYDQYYGPNEGNAGGYLGTYFMYEMFHASDYTTDGVGGGNDINDPRWRYYFYRQVGSINPVDNGFDVKALGCTPGVPPPHYQAANVKMFCVFEPGFYGRDHGDASGTPPDGPVLTTAGVYPAGGRPDNNSEANSAYSKKTKRGDGADGAGIQPIWMSPYTDFLKAEVVARAGNAPAAKTLLTSAIKNSIQSVKTFADGKKQSVTIAPWSSEAWVPNNGKPFDLAVTAYTTAVSLAYDAAGNKMDVIGREFWKSLWGNGLEGYNLYRRTGAPTGMQPTLQPNPGPWMRTIVYPSVFVNLNSSATQRDANATNKVFWDNNLTDLD